MEITDCFCYMASCDSCGEWFHQISPIKYLRIKLNNGYVLTAKLSINCSMCNNDPLHVDMVY